MGREVITREEKVAQKIIDLITDLRLDLDMIGIYFARLARLSTYRRFENIYEAMVEYKQDSNDREKHYERINNV